MAVGQIISRAIAQGAVTTSDINDGDITHAKLHTDMDLSSKTVTMPAVIRGPATLTIDPAAVGDNTGLVVIAGNFQVDGTTTTINSTTMTVDDKNLVLASGAGNASAADGAGITIDGASATMLYTHATTSFDFNKTVNITGNLGVSGTVDGIDIATRDAVLTSTTTTAGAALPKAGGAMTGKLEVVTTGNDVTADFQGANGKVKATRYGHLSLQNTDNSTTESFALSLRSAGGMDISYGTPNASHSITTGGSIMRFTNDGNVGIGNTSPSARLHVKSAGTGNVLYVESSDGHHLGGFYQESDTRAAFNVRDAGGNVKVNLDAGGDSWFTGGDVGFGITSPSAPIDVVTNSVVYAAEFTQSNTSNGDGVFISVGSTASVDYALTVRSNAGNTSVLAAKADGKVGIGVFSPVSTLNVEATKTTALSTAAHFLTLGLTIDDNTAYNNTGVGGGIAFRGKRNAGGVQTVYGAIDAGKDDAAGDQYKGNLRFYTNQNSTGVPLERMRIDSSGHIIAGPFGGNSNAVIRGSSSPGYTNQPGTNLLLKSGDGSGTGSSFMSFYTSPAGSSGTSVNTAQERMRIDSTGRLLLGPDAQDIQIDPASTNSGINLLYMRGNASGDKAEISLNHYGHHNYHIGAGLVGNGLFSIGTAQTATGIVMNTSGNVSIGGTTTDYKLRVRGAASGGGKVLIQTDGSFASTDEAMLDFRHYDDSGDPAGRISFKGTTNYTGDILFKVRAGGTSGAGGASLQERMRISHGGVDFSPNTSGSFRFKGNGGNQLSIVTSAYTAGAGTNIAQANVQIVNSAFGALVFVAAYNAPGYPGAQFCDLVYFGYNASPTIIAQQTIAGSPPTRYYTGAGYALYLRYSSNVLTTKVNCIQSHS